MDTATPRDQGLGRQPAIPPQNDFPYGIVADIHHRPWPMPAGPWVMTQSWHDLLFAHWPIDVSQLESKVPRHFEIDRFDGQAWIGIVPFYMANVTPRAIPALPWLSRFPEVNVRTYVRVGDKPGVFFFSLDATNPLAVRTARLLFRLPYHSAKMSVHRSGPEIHYRSIRRGRSSPGAELDAVYRPAGQAFLPRPGSLEHFLTERYCFYALNHLRQPYRLEIHHPVWPLQPAEATINRNTLAAASGLTPRDQAPLLHFAKRQDIVAWMPEQVRTHATNRG